jgi:DNA-directed RNA polymerase subunit RPC12/RpoP
MNANKGFNLRYSYTCIKCGEEFALKSLGFRKVHCPVCGNDVKVNDNLEKKEK